MPTTDDVKDMLHGFAHTFTKQELYFRNQEKLMRNAVIPEADKHRLNQKMKFQS
jgi:hypothetical protein